MDCYIRIRAELNDGSFTDYSSCVLIINPLFMENQKHIQHYFQDICVPIHGPCSTGSAPDFYINGLSTSWPESGDQLYNITLHSQTYRFCFRNITEDVIITEYCFQDHIAGCSLCSFQDGERVFQSHSEIFKLIPVAPMSSSTSPGIGPNSLKRSDYTSTTVSTHMDAPITTPTNMNNSRSIPLLMIVGVASIGTICVLIGVAMLFLLIIMCCRRNSDDATCLQIHKARSGNIYEEPSLPNPLYQELDNIDMIRNDSYSHVILQQGSTVTHAQNS